MALQELKTVAWAFSKDPSPSLGEHITHQTSASKCPGEGPRQRSCSPANFRQGVYSEFCRGCGEEGFPLPPRQGSCGQGPGAHDPRPVGDTTRDPRCCCRRVLPHGPCLRRDGTARTPPKISRCNSCALSRILCFRSDPAASRRPGTAALHSPGRAERGATFPSVREQRLVTDLRHGYQGDNLQERIINQSGARRARAHQRGLGRLLAGGDALPG